MSGHYEWTVGLLNKPNLLIRETSVGMLQAEA